MQAVTELFRGEGADLSMEDGEGSAAKTVLLILSQPGCLFQGEGVEAEDGKVVELVRMIARGRYGPKLMQHAIGGLRAGTEGEDGIGIGKNSHCPCSTYRAG